MAAFEYKALDEKGRNKAGVMKATVLVRFANV